MSIAQQLKRRVLAQGGQVGRRFPSELRSELVSFARKRAASGARPGAIARMLGVSEPSVRRWLASEPAGELMAVGTLEVPVRSLRVTVPGGLVVEGLDVDGVAALSRALTS